MFAGAGHEREVCRRFLGKGEPQRDTRWGSLRKFEAAPDGSPSAAFRAASPGYHYYSRTTSFRMSHLRDGHEPVPPSVS